MAFSSYKRRRGAKTTTWGLQSVSQLTSPVRSFRARVGNTQTSYSLDFAQLRPGQVEESGGVIDMLNDNQLTATASLVAPDGTTQTVRFENASSNVHTATHAGVTVALLKVR